MRGEIERGRGDLEALIARLGASHYSQVNRAMAEACLGDRESLYESLERAAQARDVLFVSVPADPMFDRYHDDHAFTALLRRHGLNLLPLSPLEPQPRRAEEPAARA